MKLPSQEKKPLKLGITKNFHVIFVYLSISSAYIGFSITLIQLLENLTQEL